MFFLGVVAVTAVILRIAVGFRQEPPRSLGMLIFWTLVVPTALVLALLIVDQLACWAERRGWIYWRNRSRTGGASVLTGPAFEAFNPSVRHVVEERERQRLEVKMSPAGQDRETASSIQIEATGE